jgi:flavin reductase (DIM6/NTAB) family NADH-FMN oxidoreductase RutF
MTQAMNESGIAPDAFFAIMSRFASGVAVVTTLDADGAPKGLTSSAVCSVSAAPPLLLVCVDRASRTLPALLDRGEWVVNFLGADRHTVSALFAGKGDDKFRGITWRPAHNGMPWLHEDALSHAVCRTEEVIEAGDHVVLLGRVEAGEVTPGIEQPLVYFKRTYHTLGNGPSAQ